MAAPSDVEADVKRYPLQELLELRRRDEESAAAAWAAARRRADLAEAEGARLAARAAEARARLDQAMGPAPAPTSSTTAATGAELAGTARYLARLREAATRAAAERDAFRKGPLAAARTEERRTAEIFAETRGTREASEGHEAQFRADERRSEERREEEARDDAARAVHHARRGSDPRR